MDVLHARITNAKYGGEEATMQVRFGSGAAARGGGAWLLDVHTPAHPPTHTFSCVPKHP